MAFPLVIFWLNRRSGAKVQSFGLFADDSGSLAALSLVIRNPLYRADAGVSSRRLGAGAGDSLAPWVAFGRPLLASDRDVVF
jgi:hypothetical protein